MKDNKLNILEINFSRAWGGLEMQMPIIARGLKNLGHNVIVVCPEGSQAGNKTFQSGIKTIYLEYKVKYIDIFTIWKLKKIIEENKIDIIHSHMAKDLWLIIPAAKIAGCKKIYFTRHMESYYRKKDFLHYFLHRSLTGTIAITEAIKESLLYTTHIPSEKIKVIYCGLDIEKFYSSSFRKNVLKEEYKLPENCFLIGTVGRLDKGKGQEYLLQAAALIIKKFPHIKIFIVGEETKGEDSGYIDYLKSIVRELKLENYVVFTGFRSDVPVVMNSLDILVMPSEREAFGLVAIEAMMMRKPVIATESLGTREIIDDGVDGFLVPYGNSEILAEKIVNVLSNPDQMKKIGTMARKKVEEKFDFNKNIKKVEELFLENL